MEFSELVKKDGEISKERRKVLEEMEPFAEACTARDVDASGEIIGSGECDTEKWAELVGRLDDAHRKQKELMDGYFGKKS